MMQSWGSLVARRAWVVLIGGLALFAATAVYGLGVFDNLSDGGFEDPASESARSLAKEQASFTSHDPDIVAIYSSPSMKVADQAFQASITNMISGLPPGSVQRVITWYDTGLPTLISNDEHSTRVIVTLRGTSQSEKSTRYDEVKTHLGAKGLTTNIGGPWAVFNDVNQTVSKDIARAEGISMPIVFILCLLIFGSLVSALMPVLVGAVAVFGAFALVRAITMVTEVSVFAINVITLIGMGLAIDYALFIVSRFREELAKAPGADREHVNAAIAATMATAGRTVLFSGLIVGASIASLRVFPQNFLRSMGYGGVAAVLVAMVAALTLLPALLSVLGPRIEAGRMPWRRSSRARAAARHQAGHGDLTHAHGAWAALAHSVMRRPVAYLLVIVVALVALGSPFLSARWGSVDERVLPVSAPSRVAADLGVRDFGGESSSANIVVEGAGDSQLRAYIGRLTQAPGVRSVQLIDQVTEGGKSASLVQVSWPGNSQLERSQQTVKDLRAIDPGRGATALVGGASADAVDLVDSIGAHLPWMGVFVVIVMLVLLFVAFGSLILPLKAVLMNAVSLGASFGVVTWIFQEGHLSGLLGFVSPGYLDVTQPILMLGIIFGLSMDYEVFLLSRVREEWDRTGDNTTAVANGLQRSGRIITSAALLLAVVIGGFALSGIVIMKMIGIGMLVAVLLDATVVRALLVPATMRLLGDANWWAPGPLRRWWERHAVRERKGAEVSWTGSQVVGSQLVSPSRSLLVSPPRESIRQDLTMTTLLLGPADLHRRRGLRRMRAVALSLLGFAAVVFILTRNRDGAWGYVNATAEAAMVGALADWFAVTALFRHPLGIPVPHTAIIPQRKDALGQSLEEFVTGNFLTADAARERVAAADVSRRMGRWLAQEQHSARVISEVADLSSRALAAIKDDDVRGFVEQSLLPRLVNEPLSPLVGHLLESVVHDRAHRGLVDIALVEVHAWLRANEDTVATIVGARAPWWTPAWLDDRVIARVHDQALSWVADVRDHPNHSARAAFDDLLTQLAIDLQQDPDTIARAEALKVRVMTHPQIGASAVAVWDALRIAILGALDDADGPLRRRAVGSLSEFGERLLNDPELRQRVDGHAADAIGFVVSTYGHEIAKVISQTVDRWDGKEAAERIELHVGRDLQFIRINGTIVGGLAGLVIHTLNVLL
jgi:RND superfamily putative drug exporter